MSDPKTILLLCDAREEDMIRSLTTSLIDRARAVPAADWTVSRPVRDPGTVDLTAPVNGDRLLTVRLVRRAQTSHTIFVHSIIASTADDPPVLGQVFPLHPLADLLRMPANRPHTESLAGVLSRITVIGHAELDEIDLLDPRSDPTETAYERLMGPLSTVVLARARMPDDDSISAIAAKHDADGWHVEFLNPMNEEHEPHRFDKDESAGLPRIFRINFTTHGHRRIHAFDARRSKMIPDSTPSNRFFEDRRSPEPDAMETMRAVAAIDAFTKRYGTTINPETGDEL